MATELTEDELVEALRRAQVDRGEGRALLEAARWMMENEEMSKIIDEEWIGCICYSPDHAPACFMGRMVRAARRAGI